MLYHNIYQVFLRRFTGLPPKVYKIPQTTLKAQLGSTFRLLVSNSENSRILLYKYSENSTNSENSRILLYKYSENSTNSENSRILLYKYSENSTNSENSRILLYKYSENSTNSENSRILLYKYSENSTFTFASTPGTIPFDGTHNGYR